MIGKINKLIKKSRCSAVLLVNFHEIEENFYYYSGLEFGGFGKNALILRKNKKPLLLTTKLEYEQVKKNKKLAVKLIENKKEFVRIIAENIKGKKIGCNFELMPVNFRKKLAEKLRGKKLIDASGALQETRAVKTSEEVKRITQAVRITQKILNEVPAIIRKHKKKGRVMLTEKGLAGILERKAREKGAQGLAFDAIVASGKNGATPHYLTGSRKIGGGFLLIDFGIRYKNYCSDLSRTFFVGKAGKKERELYEIVFEAKKEAEKIIKPGATFGKIMDKVENYLKKKGFMLIHGLGHGLGLKVHDEPKGFLKESSKKILRNQVLTVEPGIYNEKFGGIRIEDDVLITGKGIKKLSKAPKKLIEL